MNKITLSMLKDKIDYLNEITNSPRLPYEIIDEGVKTRLKANIGNFHLYQAYNAYGLHRMVNEGGGVSDSYVNGLHTKRELLDRLSALIAGIEFKTRNFL